MKWSTILMITITLLALPLFMSAVERGAWQIQVVDSIGCAKVKRPVEDGGRLHPRLKEARTFLLIGALVFYPLLFVGLFKAIQAKKMILQQQQVYSLRKARRTILLALGLILLYSALLTLAVLYGVSYG